MLSNIEWVTSDGVASITAAATADFPFSSSAYVSTGNGGNVVLISNKTGGLARVSFAASDPDGTITNLADDEALVFLDGGNAQFIFAPGTDIVEVRITPIGDNWGQTGVSLARHLGS